MADLPYDVFISYNPADREWVEKWLLPHLEQAGFRVAIDSRDFVIGMSAIDNIERAVEASHRTIVVLTQDWVKSEWNDFEGLLLRTKDPSTRERRLLPILLKPCELPKSITALKLHVADMTHEPNWEREFRRIRRDIDDVLPVEIPIRTEARWSFDQWRRWANRYRRELRNAIAGLFLFAIIFSLLFELGPFQKRWGWNAISIQDGKGRAAKNAWHLARNGNVLLVSTSVDMNDCKGLQSSPSFWISRDTGNTWSGRNLELPDQECVREPIAAFGTNSASFERLYAATWGAGLWRSEDGGDHWQQLQATTSFRDLGQVVVAPDNPDLVFVSAREGGLWRSNNAGTNWDKLSDGQSCKTNPNGISLPENFLVGAMLYTNSALFVGSGKSNIVPTYAGLYVSYDQGNCWQLAQDGKKELAYLELAQVAEESNRIYALVHAKTVMEKPPNELWELRRSESSFHATWVWSTNVSVNSLYVSRETPARWYVSTPFGQVFYRALDQTNEPNSFLPITQCLLTCATDLIMNPADLKGPPLFLANDRVFKLDWVPWYRVIIP